MIKKVSKKSRRPVRRLLRTAASRTYLLPPPAVWCLFGLIALLMVINDFDGLGALSDVRKSGPSAAIAVHDVGLS